MKKLQNNFTTIEQSKRLLELGVPAWTADCYFVTSVGKTPNIIHSNLHFDLECKTSPKPCWSVGRLMEIFETCTSTKFERWSHRGVIRPLLEDCIEHIEFAINPDTIMEMDFSKLE